MQIPRSSTPIPRTAKLALNLLWCALTVGVVVRLASISPLQIVWTKRAVGTLTLVVAVQGYLILAMWAGQSAARWVDLLLVAFAFIVWPPKLAYPQPFLNALDLGQVLAHMVAFTILFTGRANAWFMQESRGDDA